MRVVRPLVCGAWLATPTGTLQRPGESYSTDYGPLSGAHRASSHSPKLTQSRRVRLKLTPRRSRWRAEHQFIFHSLLIFRKPKASYPRAVDDTEWAFSCKIIISSNEYAPGCIRPCRSPLCGRKGAILWFWSIIDRMRVLISARRLPVVQFRRQRAVNQ